MKRILYLSMVFVLITTFSLSAQLQVDSLGRTFVGYEIQPTASVRTLNVASPDSTAGLNIGNMFSIYSKSSNGFVGGYISTSNTDHGLRMSEQGKIKIVPNDGDLEQTLETTAGYTYYSPYTTIYPQYSEAAVNIITNGSVGLHSIIKYPTTTTGIPMEGIRSDVTNSSAYPFVAYQKWGGYSERTFYVKGNGEVYAGGGYVELSDANQKEDIETITTSSLAKIESLRPVTYRFKNNAPQQNKSQNNTTTTTNTNPKKIGLIAQEVELVIPEAVRTAEDGTKGIAYNEIIPLLINAIQELNTAVKDQQIEIAELQAEIEELKSPSTPLLPQPITTKSVAQNSSSISNDIDEAYMSQNAPNPFSGEAEIIYQVPQTAISAYIGIYNLNGLQIQQYPLEKGAGTVTISAGNLSSGIYIYSLIIDGEEVETRRMVVQ